MKKVLSVAMASAMVLGMGVNAFADISYNTGAGTTEIDLKGIGLAFDGQLTVWDDDDKVVDSTNINNTNGNKDLKPGYTVYMPLFANNQLAYTSQGSSTGTVAKDAIQNIGLTFTNAVYDNAATVATALNAISTTTSGTVNSFPTGKFTVTENTADHTLTITLASDATVVVAGATRKAVNPKVTYTWDATASKYNITDVKVDAAAVAATTGTSANDYVTTGSAGYGRYTSEIGKNWSINFTEKSGNIVEKAEFYRAAADDKGLMPRAWYIKVELKDNFDSVEDGEVYYKVYVADNNNQNTTNKVYVKADYKNAGEKEVDFEWTNNANTAAIWKVKKNENGTAVFDFKDKAFFTVKMYSEEKMFLDLNTAYQKAVAGDFDADFDSFFEFKGTHANFSRAGELIIESNDEDMYVYQIVDGDLVPVEAEYAKNYKVTHTNKKLNGYVFNTKELGNYVLSKDELVANEEEEVAEETTEEAKEETTEAKPEKVNPDTGANDFVGVAVALAVVSVAAAGALTLKK